MPAILCIFYLITVIVCQQGGVGKTTPCANPGIGLAQEGKKVLRIDGNSLCTVCSIPPDTLPGIPSGMRGRVLTHSPSKPSEGILHHAECVEPMPTDTPFSDMKEAQFAGYSNAESYLISGQDFIHLRTSPACATAARAGLVYLISGTRPLPKQR